MTARLGLFPVPEGLRCAVCNAVPTTAQIVANDYRCPGCGVDLGHLDLAPSGMVRGVLGWLHSPGDVLAGRYRVRGFLGKGGFAATYLVDDQRLAGKRRAVKEVPELFFDERETAILARIQHPAVPDITDRFTADGMVYLVLEFGGERTLEGVREAEGGRIPLARLSPWIDQLCDVLAHLHAQKPPIVHRDLKPSNVLLDENDRVMLIDFGIAKEAAPNVVTRTVARSASHGFSPPEQVMGTGTDERSDVYALGATLYVLLTGEIPPPAHERVAGMEVVPPRRLASDLPQAVEEAILRALELNVARRHATIAEFRRALADALAAPAPARKSTAPRTVVLAEAPGTGLVAATPTGAAAKAAAGGAVPAPGRQRGTPVVLIAATALLLALGAGATWWLIRGEDKTAEKPSLATIQEPTPTSSPEPVPIAPTVEPPPAPPVTPTATVTSLPSATLPPASGPSAIDELLRNRPVRTEPTEPPEAEPPEQGAKLQPPSKEPQPSSVPKQIRKPQPQPSRTTARQPTREPAGTGWEDFQGPSGGYERKVQ